MIVHGTTSQWTTFANAKSLVKSGSASISDFWLFAGYAGWGPNQLSGELDRKSWYMCATDSQTLLKELARQSSGVDPRDAGLEAWELLMNMIGRGETARKVSGKFDDLMLKVSESVCNVVVLFVACLISCFLLQCRNGVEVTFF